MDGETDEADDSSEEKSHDPDSGQFAVGYKGYVDALSQLIEDSKRKPADMLNYVDALSALIENSRERSQDFTNTPSEQLSEEYSEATPPSPTQLSLPSSDDSSTDTKPQQTITHSKSLRPRSNPSSIISPGMPSPKLFTSPAAPKSLLVSTVAEGLPPPPPPAPTIQEPSVLAVPNSQEAVQGADNSLAAPTISNDDGVPHPVVAGTMSEPQITDSTNTLDVAAPEKPKRSKRKPPRKAAVALDGSKSIKATENEQRVPASALTSTGGGGAATPQLPDQPVVSSDGAATNTIPQFPDQPTIGSENAVQFTTNSVTIPAATATPLSKSRLRKIESKRSVKSPASPFTKPKNNP